MFAEKVHATEVSIMANISECSTATNERTVCAKNVSVEAGLAALEDRQSRRRCRQAYKFLMKICASSYKLFIHKHQNALETNNKINLYDYTNIEGIECCLWPNLYPYTSWCETTLKGNESRQSSKIAFITKLFSNIVDYGTTYDLLQFHYDMWIFKTVTGAISSARRIKCSPARVDILAFL